MQLVLDAAEVRVLGSLLEKEITTPEYYPMTLNALVNACNQKSNRDPVVSYDDDTVYSTLNRLREKRLASTITGGSNRVPKYSHRINEMLNLGRRELAVVCELMVRGPQTLGELRDRASRMHSFSDVDEVERLLSAMAERGLVTRLPKLTGTKEPRWAHLLSGEIDVNALAAEESARHAPGPRSDRVAELEQTIRNLEQRLADLEAQFRQFKANFE
jgi:uncharacterized protein YceH (UPF0502 family)